MLKNTDSSTSIDNKGTSAFTEFPKTDNEPLVTRVRQKRK